MLGGRSAGASKGGSAAVLMSPPWRIKPGSLFSLLPLACDMVVGGAPSKEEEEEEGFFPLSFLAMVGLPSSFPRRLLSFWLGKTRNCDFSFSSCPSYCSLPSDHQETRTSLCPLSLFFQPRFSPVRIEEKNEALFPYTYVSRI